MEINTWLAFVVASFATLIIPGPNSLLALTHGAIHGYKKTQYTILGGSLGFVLLIALCMFGIAAIIQTSQMAFLGIKIFGGCYLIWLGIKTWKSDPINISVNPLTMKSSRFVLFRQGFITAAMNPKALIFFTALLPHFIEPSKDIFIQFLCIAITYVIIECSNEFLFATMAIKIRPWLVRVGKKFNRFCGGIFIFLGTLVLSRE